MVGISVIIAAVSVDNSAPAGVKRWNITFEDQNYDCRQGMRSSKSGFAVQGGKVSTGVESGPPFGAQF